MNVVIVTSSIVEPEEHAVVDQPLIDALIARGVSTAAVCWDDADHDWSSTDLAVIRSTWDYFPRRDEFLAWTEHVASVSHLENSAEVIRWNTHKSYLLELEDRGAPTLETAWLGQGDRIPLGRLLEERGWNDFVVKPAVDGGAEGLLRASTDQLEAAQAHLDRLLATGDVMVQEFLPTVETEGELSLLFIDGELTHAVQKVPAGGDFRVQAHYAATHRAVEPDPAALALASWLIEATGHTFLYCRVDLLRDIDGAWLLIELEATEPDFYFDTVPAAVEPFADAIVRRLSQIRTP